MPPVCIVVYCMQFLVRVQSGLSLGYSLEFSLGVSLKKLQLYCCKTASTSPNCLITVSEHNTQNMNSKGLCLEIRHDIHLTKNSSCFPGCRLIASGTQAIQIPLVHGPVPLFSRYRYSHFSRGNFALPAISLFYEKIKGLPATPLFPLVVTLLARWPPPPSKI